jgi:hypothetical protein
MEWWKEVLNIILVVGIFGSAFNIFIGAELESIGIRERYVFK